MSPRVIGLLSVALTVGSIPATAGPLANKGIVVQWIATGKFVRADGGHRSFNNQVTRTFYVSSSDQIFVRNTRKVLRSRGGASDVRDTAPDEVTTEKGRAIKTRLVGNQLIHQVEMIVGAVQVVVDFDPSFTSCSAVVFYGKAGADPIRQNRITGDITVLSMKANSISCNVTAGNPFSL